MIAIRHEPAFAFSQRVGKRSVPEHLVHNAAGAWTQKPKRYRQPARRVLFWSKRFGQSPLETQV